MTTYLAPVRDMRFVMNELAGLSALQALPGFEEATPGLVEGGNEFYSFAGAERLREVIPTFTKGRAIVGVTSTPFKCPPAPSEAALLLHDYLTQRGLRDACEISIVMPFGAPIPPSPETSQAPGTFRFKVIARTISPPLPATHRSPGSRSIRPTVPRRWRQVTAASRDRPCARSRCSSCAP